MALVRVALVQMAVQGDRAEMRERQARFIEAAGHEGARMACLQELALYPWFPAEQNRRWFQEAETVPGESTEYFARLAARLEMVLIVPLFERDGPDLYYNTAAVIDADGRYLGKYRKTHLYHAPGFWERFYFQPGRLGFPVFDTAYGKIGVFLDYDRHFPEVARALAMGGAEILFNPCSTVTNLSQYLWFLEQRALAAFNGVFVGAVNRVGQAPPGQGAFYGSSYLADPFAEILAQGSQDQDEVVVADLDMSRIDRVRAIWPFHRDYRPDLYR